MLERAIDGLLVTLGITAFAGAALLLLVLGTWPVWIIVALVVWLFRVTA